MSADVGIRRATFDSNVGADVVELSEGRRVSLDSRTLRWEDVRTITDCNFLIEALQAKVAKIDASLRDTPNGSELWRNRTMVARTYTNMLINKAQMKRTEMRSEERRRANEASKEAFETRICRWLRSSHPDLYAAAVAFARQDERHGQT